MTSIEKEMILADGKAKTIYQTNDPEIVWVHSKDQATALNGKRKVQITNKGHYTNQISWRLFKYLQDQGIINHFIAVKNDTDILTKKLTMIPLEVVVRNYASGHFVMKYHVTPMLKLEPTVLEFYDKSDALDDPMMNDLQIQALHILDAEQIAQVKAQAFQINQQLQQLFAQMKIDLIDIKFEFGWTASGAIILGDELSPDNMRLVDQQTGHSLDKDVFRQETGNLVDGYAIVLERLQQILGD